MFRRSPKPGGRAGEGFTTRWLNRLWLAREGAELVRATAPTTANSVTVRVVGMPHAILDQLLQISISIASSIVRPFQLVADKFINVQINHRDKIVETTIAYEASGFISGIQQLIGESGPGIVTRPAPDTITGGEWPTLLVPNRADIGGQERPLTGTKAQQLPWNLQGAAGRYGSIVGQGVVALTSEPAENPQGVFDLGTRNDLVAIVTAALKGNCETPAPPKTAKLDPAKSKADGDLAALATTAGVLLGGASPQSALATMTILARLRAMFLAAG